MTSPLAVADALAYAAPMDLGVSLGFLGARAIPGVEELSDGRFTRTLNLPGGPALITVSPGDGAVECELTLTDEADRAPALQLARRLLDLDTDPAPIRRALARDLTLAPLLRARPGLRSPGAVDGFEMAVRAVVGQQISVAGARTVLGRIAARYGRPAIDQRWLLFPRAADLATADPADLPMPRARGRTLLALATAVSSGEIDLTGAADRTTDRATTRATLLRIPGIGPWTADYVCMRALGDPDVLLATDLGVRKAAAALNVPLDDGQHRWAPWRSYVTHHLWAALH